MSKLRESANAFIKESQKYVNPRWYPSYHLAPPVGWMNDPNGLTWFNGQFHAFYQHYPHAPEWGPMHWGHARSRDMVRWESLPVALAPEGEEDKDGCFSGSAVVSDGKLCLIYTGHKFVGEPIDDNLYQVQCLATSLDGVTFCREGQVLDTPLGLHHFRDPKVWREDEYWYMVVGAKTQDVGEVQIYRSDDLRSWQFESTITSMNICGGYMWECPDLFPLGEKHILLFSPQGLEAQGYRYRNLYQSGYAVGHWKAGKPFIVEQPFQELDYGHDFYAPQSFTTPDGRRVIMGWLAMWESAMPEKADGWAGMLTIPRELTLTDSNKILQQPVKEMETLRGEPLCWQPGELQDTPFLLADNAEAMEVVLTWDTSRSTAEKYGLRLGDGAQIYIDSQSQRIVLDRHFPEWNLSGCRSVPLPEGEQLTLRIFIDKSSLEVFVNAGEYTLSSRIYPQDHHRSLSLFSQHGVATVRECCAWPLSCE
ncbi:glycoside hydrolase family 32 protein [Kluyvera sp. STS39-E]|uniref:glycoside hydrolase family 32 protein n=1 Tax=Kluyvera sp. STS39-E TaxID=3234748 RepID=UPI0034C5C390